MYLLVKLSGKPIVRVVRAKRPSFKDSHALILKKRYYLAFISPTSSQPDYMYVRAGRLNN